MIMAGHKFEVQGDFRMGAVWRPFTKVVEAPNEAQAKAWLAVCGSKAGQDAFNPAKGSIPARTDADKNLYDVYLKYSIDAFGKETLAPSVVHGAAAPEAYMTSYGNALNVFGADLDPQTLLSALKDAAKDIK